MMMPGLRLGLQATVLYIGLIAVASFLVFQMGLLPVDVPQTLWRLLPFQLGAVLLCVFVAMRVFGWGAVGFGRLHWPALGWLLPSWIVLGIMAWDIAQVLSWAELRALGGGLSVLVVTTFLIAFGEEVMFRGILLRGAMASVPLLFAMLISAVLFGLLHVVSGIAGQGMSGTLQQMAFALLVGFYLAPIAIRLGNLWPLIIWHWGWNMVVFGSQMVDVMHPSALIGIAMQAVICMVLWAEMIRVERLR